MLEGHHLQFAQYQTVNLLEQLMAASRDLLEKHRSTEIDQKPQIQSVAELFPSTTDNGAAASTSEENAVYIAEEINFNDSNDDFRVAEQQNEDKVIEIN